MTGILEGGRSVKGRVIDDVEELVRDQAFMMSVGRLIRKRERIDGCYAGIAYSDEYGEVMRLLREKGTAT